MTQILRASCGNGVSLKDFFSSFECGNKWLVIFCLEESWFLVTFDLSTFWLILSFFFSNTIKPNQLTVIMGLCRDWSGHWLEYYEEKWGIFERMTGKLEKEWLSSFTEVWIMLVDNSKLFIEARGDVNLNIMIDVDAVS